MTDDVSRRQMLLGAPALAYAAGTAKPARKLKVIVTGGHPGDPEYGCGGTVARYADAGHDVVLLYLNRGDWGFLNGPAPYPESTRVDEAQRACKLLGARPLFADQLNGRAVVDAPHYASFHKILVDEQPDVLFTHWPIDGHADHRAAYTLVYDAWLKMGKRAALYFYEVSTGEDTLMFAPAHYVSIAATEARKREACFAHASQTPERYYALQAQVSRFRGVESGVAYAEAFIRHAHSPADLLPS